MNDFRLENIRWSVLLITLVAVSSLFSVTASAKDGLAK